MWAKVKDNVVTRIFSRPQWIEVDGVKYPPQVFHTSKLTSLKILPITVQEDPIPGDSLFYTQRSSYEVQDTQVIKRISYTIKSEEDVAFVVEEQKHQLYKDFMAEIEALKKEKMMEAGVAFESDLPQLTKNEINALVIDFKSTLDGIQNDDILVKDKLIAKKPERRTPPGRIV